MFTGIINEIGKVKSITRKGTSLTLEVVSKTLGEGLTLGDSIAVNGVCLSITKKNSSLFFDIVGNTLSGTNLKRLKTGDAVNLESALKLGDTLSGHMVSGHVDGERLLKNNLSTSKGWAIDVGILREDRKYLVSKGSVALDGVSLTVSEVTNSFFRVFLIPHTLDNTTLKSKKRGERVNVEFDMMGKYSENKRGESSITKDLLQKNGFV